MYTSPCCYPPLFRHRGKKPGIGAQHAHPRVTRGDSHLARQYPQTSVVFATKSQIDGKAWQPPAAGTRSGKTQIHETGRFCVDRVEQTLARLNANSSSLLQPTLHCCWLIIRIVHCTPKLWGCIEGTRGKKRRSKRVYTSASPSIAPLKNQTGLTASSGQRTIMQ